MPYRPNFPIPAVIDPPKQCIQIMIPNHPEWKAVIAGLLFELSYWFNWERTGDTSGAQCAAVWKEVFNSIDWSDMSCCCDAPAITVRINATTGNVEQSSDGGATWQPQPGGLPSLIVQPVPPVTSGVSATKCDAATNVTGQVDVWIDQVSNDFTTAISLLEFGVAVLEAILIAVVTILSAGVLTAAEALVLPTIAAALFAAWGAGKTVFDAYWTTDVKDAILCAVVCHIGDDGSFTDAQFSATWTDINDQLPPSPAKMLFMGFLSSVGAPGLNAMAATGTAADADCGDCECSDFVRLWVSTGGGTEDLWDGEWLYASPVHDGSHYTLFVQRTNPADTFDQDFCASIEIELLTGTIDVLNSAMRVCGGSGLVPIGIAPFPGTCVCQVAIRNFEDVPFTVRMRGTAC